MRAFRIVVAAHGDFASGLLGAARLICGDLDDVAAVALLPEDSPESFGERLVAACGDDLPLLILTDLVGGTPHNVALATVRRRQSAHLISGVNLAVLIEAAMCPDVLDADSVDRFVLAGRSALDAAVRPIASGSP